MRRCSRNRKKLKLTRARDDVPDCFGGVLLDKSWFVASADSFQEQGIELAQVAWLLCRVSWLLLCLFLEAYVA